MGLFDTNFRVSLTTILDLSQLILVYQFTVLFKITAMRDPPND